MLKWMKTASSPWVPIDNYFGVLIEFTRLFFEIIASGVP